MQLQVDNDIELKVLDLPDAEIIFHTLDSEREYLREWLPFVDETKKVEDSLAFVKCVKKCAKQKKEYTFKILYKGSFAGLIGFRDTDLDDRRTEIGYWLSREYQGHGIILRSCHKLIEFAFYELNMNRIQIKVATHNYKSQKIPLKLGFKEEGIEREGEMLVTGWADLVVYSLLLEDYDKIKKT